MTPQRPLILLEGPSADLHRDRYDRLVFTLEWGVLLRFFCLFFFACMLVLYINIHKWLKHGKDREILLPGSRTCVQIASKHFCKLEKLVGNKIKHELLRSIMSIVSSYVVLSPPSLFHHRRRLIGGSNITAWVTQHLVIFGQVPNKHGFSMVFAVYTEEFVRFVMFGPSYGVSAWGLPMPSWESVCVRERERKKRGIPAPLIHVMFF